MVTLPKFRKEIINELMRLGKITRNYDLFELGYYMDLVNFQIEKLEENISKCNIPEALSWYEDAIYTLNIVKEKAIKTKIPEHLQLDLSPKVITNMKNEIRAGLNEGIRTCSLRGLIR